LQFVPGEYAKQAKLGAGAFAVVHKCFDVRQHRIFVAKEINWHRDEVCLLQKDEI
jgi:hypothetical protein